MKTIEYMHTKFLNRLLLTAALIAVTSSSVYAAPQGLLNKTITITWGESGTYTRISDGASASPIGQFQLMVYVSSQGRAFVRGSSKAGRFGGTRERGPEQTSNNVQFSGNSLIMTKADLGIARRILTTFDGSFASCNTTVTIGKIGANAMLTGFDGAVYKVLSIQPGSASCAIANGNSMAN